VKVFKTAIPILITASLLVAASSCSSKEESAATTKTLTATVQQGDISLEITGTGNLAFSETEDLTFDIAGTVEEVMVTAGETVTKGQELAKLDTSVWEDEIKSLEKSLVSAKRSLVSAKRAVSSKELSLRQAELDLQSTEDDLDDIAIVKYAQEAVDNAENALINAQENYSSSPEFWKNKIEAIFGQLTQAKAYLKEVLNGTNLNITGDIALQIAKKVLTVDQAKLQLESAQAAVDDAKAAVDDAEETVAESEYDLAEAQNLSPIITAPFNGFITKVNVNGGEEVQKGTVVIQLADPDKFKANIQVTEEDISSIELNGTATVTIDAFEVSYLATITAIAPTATVSSGVVSYKVTVELDTTRIISSISNFPSGMIRPEGFSDNGTSSSGMGWRDGFSGNMTLPEGMTLPAGFSANVTPPSGLFPGFGNQSTNTSTESSDISLKDGLTVTVVITVTQADNVLIVPTKALTRSSQTYTVQVVNGDTTETRTVTIGDSDDSNTEITSGLTEGETITYTVSSSSSSSSSSNSQQGFSGVGGMGGFSGGGGPPGGF
jgi:multidrug efflux pump subunit AcrA (membrane-fusion protein)